MTDYTAKPISISRTIAAPAGMLFAFLSDPAEHPAIDGSGMLREGTTSPVIRAVGDAFAMSMHNDEMGDYEMTNHVVAYELDRRIGWEPVLSVASRAEDSADIGLRHGHIWSYELTPVGEDATVVTESFDCSRAPEWLRKVVGDGSRWAETMTTTLENLDRKCTQT
jgi:hypothetical protein